MLFVDTSALYALHQPSDPQHDRASDVWSTIRRNHEPLVTTNYVITETIALLHRRQGLKAVASLHENIVPLIDLYFIEEPIHAAAAELLLDRNLRGLSFVDCSSFLFMRHARIRQAFAYDDHFKAFGFELI